MTLTAGVGFELRVAYEAAGEETRYRADGACVEDIAAQTSGSCLSKGLSQRQSVPQASASFGKAAQAGGRAWGVLAGGQPGSLAGQAGRGFDRGTVPQRTRSESAGVAKGGKRHDKAEQSCRRATSAMGSQADAQACHASHEAMARWLEPRRRAREFQGQIG